MAFDTQITDLIGGTIDQTACDQWAADACKDIIHNLPDNLKERCSTVSELDDSPTSLDLDGIGQVLYVTRLSADSGGYQVPCRQIPSKYGGLATDSTDLNYYGTASDPVYWIQSNTSDAGTLFVKPATTSAQKAYIHHITYPSVNVSDVSTIANFPDEAEHLVVLYVASKQLLQYQSTMSSSWNSDITTALGKVTAALGKMDTHTWDNEETFKTANSQITRVKDALDKVSSLIEGNKPASSFDAHDLLAAEDLELLSGNLQIASMEMNRASSHIAEWNAIGAMALQDANGSIGEASARLQQDVTKYQWYGDQYAKLLAEYQRGLVALKGA
jgi:hypothetical protein